MGNKVLVGIEGEDVHFMPCFDFEPYQGLHGQAASVSARVGYFVAEV